MSPPSPAALREVATEDAKIRVSALLQVFGQPDVTHEQIEKMLVEQVANTYVAGHADGWDAALSNAADAIGMIERYRSMDQVDRRANVVATCHNKHKFTARREDRGQTMSITPSRCPNCGELWQKWEDVGFRKGTPL